MARVAAASNTDVGPVRVASTPGPTGGGRWVALDLLRFCAVFLMVQGHTFSTLLDPAVRAERWYRHHLFVHGYTAPMFMFASGLAFGFTTFRAWERNTRPGPGLNKRLRRYAWLLAIGYALHLPGLSWQEFATLSPSRLRAFLQVDVLQHTGISLALCQGLAFALRRPERFAAAIAALLALVVFSAPIVWAWTGVQAWPVGLGGFVNGAEDSLFPLFPWAGFTYAGILTAYFARRASRPSHALAWPIAAAAALALLVPIAINHAGIAPYGRHDFWKTSPLYFSWRLGNVMGVLALLCFAEQALDARRSAQRPGAPDGPVLRVVRAVGQESLVVYVAHLVLLHGSVLNRGLKSHLGETLSLVQATAVALGLFASMVWLAWAWSRLEKHPPKPKDEARGRSAPSLRAA